MSVKANLPSRQIFWWAYSLYPLFMVVWTTCHMLINGGGSYPAIKWLSAGFDVLGLFCLYCFLRQKPSFTRGFWILFAIFYIMKLALALALTVSIAAHTIWNGSSSSYIALINFASIVLATPLLIAITLYAFGSKKIWAISSSVGGNA